MRKMMLVLAVTVGTVALTSCEGPSRTYTGSIKDTRVMCTLNGVYESWATWPVKVANTCSFRYSGDAEQPYALIYVAGCASLRINGADGYVSPRQRLSCVGDPIDTIGFRTCQTRGGPLPDDCTDRKTYSFAEEKWL